MTITSKEELDEFEKKTNYQFNKLNGPSLLSFDNMMPIIETPKGSISSYHSRLNKDEPNFSFIKRMPEGRS